MSFTLPCWNIIFVLNKSLLLATILFEAELTNWLASYVQGRNNEPVLYFSQCATKNPNKQANMMWYSSNREAMLGPWPNKENKLIGIKNAAELSRPWSNNSPKGELKMKWRTRVETGWSYFEDSEGIKMTFLMLCIHYLTYCCCWITVEKQNFGFPYIKFYKKFWGTSGSNCCTRRLYSWVWALCHSALTNSKHLKHQLCNLLTVAI